MRDMAGDVLDDARVKSGVRPRQRTGHRLIRIIIIIIFVTDADVTTAWHDMRDTIKNHQKHIVRCHNVLKLSELSCRSLTYNLVFRPS